MVLKLCLQFIRVTNNALSKASSKAKKVKNVINTVRYHHMSVKRTAKCFDS